MSSLDELARLTGRDRLERSLDQVVAAYVQYRNHHSFPVVPTVSEAEVLATVGVNVEALRDAPDPGLQLAAADAAVLDDSLTVKDAAERLPVGEPRVRQRLNADPPTLYGVRVNGGRWRLPAFQFALGAAVAERGGDAIAALPSGLPVRVVDAFFTRPNAVLAVNGDPTSPIRWLAEGRDQGPVVELATLVGTVP